MRLAVLVSSTRSSGDQKGWARRLVLVIVLATCAGGGAFVLVDRPDRDCDVVADMMSTYATSEAAIATKLENGPGGWQDLIAAADAQAATAAELRAQADDISSPDLRTAAIQFADGAAMFAEQRLDNLYRLPIDEDPVSAALAPPDPAEAKAAEVFFSGVRVLVATCPSARSPGRGTT